MNTDLNYPNTDPDFHSELSEKKEKPEEIQATDPLKQGILSKPANSLDWRVQIVGLNQMQNHHHPVAFAIKKRIVQRIDSKVLDEAFARCVREKLRHENQMDELTYIEERIKKDRENKTDQSEKQAKEDINHQIERSEIERFAA